MIPVHKDLEKDVMEMLLDGKDEALSVLREQYRTAEVISEETGEAGFFIHYKAAESKLNTQKYKGTFQIGDVDGTVSDVEGAVGFLLYVKNGMIASLEGYTNIIDTWPEQDTKIKLVYDNGGKRDYYSLRKKWERNARFNLKRGYRRKADKQKKEG